MSVITSSFNRAAHARTTALGMPGARIVVIPSPLVTKSVDDVKQMAHDFAPEIVGLLTSEVTAS